jgi:hypothetical protein
VGVIKAIFDADVFRLSEVLINDRSFASSMDERRRMVEANVAAAKYFRRTLLHATSGWPLEYLKDRGMETVLSTESRWKVGYAPNSWTGLVDQLRSEGFGYGTLVKAGLVTWSDVGEAQDMHRDRLMLLTTDQRLSPVGFVSIGRDGVIDSSGKVSMINRRSNTLLGVAEQRDLLSTGAIPVIVDDPADAIAISNVSRELDGRWAGIPVCGEGLSTAQARMLRRYTTSERVIVALPGTVKQRN